MIKNSLIRQAILAASANKRKSNADTKTRGQVAGGGRKPWRQKGTGRARAGSSRSPIWVGGGIVFGPSKSRNFKQKFPKKMAQAARREFFNYLLENKTLTIVDDLTLETPKTKAAILMLSKHLTHTCRLLVITKEMNPELLLATRNLNWITVLTADLVGVTHLKDADRVLVETGAAETLGLDKKPSSKSKSEKTTSSKKKTSKDAQPENEEQA